MIDNESLPSESDSCYVHVDALKAQSMNAW
jgi:hypothetical protein